MAAAPRRVALKKLFTHHDPMIAGYLHATLESSGIDAIIKNGYLSGALGELPITTAWPEVWVVHDETFDRARQILRDTLPDEAL